MKKGLARQSSLSSACSIGLAPSEQPEDGARAVGLSHFCIEENPEESKGSLAREASLIKCEKVATAEQAIQTETFLVEQYAETLRRQKQQETSQDIACSEPTQDHLGGEFTLSTTEIENSQSQRQRALSSTVDKKKEKESAVARLFAQRLEQQRNDEKLSLPAKDCTLQANVQAVIPFVGKIYAHMRREEEL